MRIVIAGVLVYQVCVVNESRLKHGVRVGRKRRKGDTSIVLAPPPFILSGAITWVVCATFRVSLLRQLILSENTFTNKPRSGPHLSPG